MLVVLVNFLRANLLITGCMCEALAQSIRCYSTVLIQSGA